MDFTDNADQTGRDLESIGEFVSSVQPVVSLSASLLVTERTQHGFQRSRCACALCRVPCRHLPGGLDVDDLRRLCPEGQDIFVWAEKHLRARTDKPYPILLPARQANGHCHWHHDGQCAVHETAPYGCAYFDSHMTKAEADRRYTATMQARKEDAATDGLYFRVWQHLCRMGLIDAPANQGLLSEDAIQTRRQVERSQRRAALRVSTRRSDGT